MPGGAGLAARRALHAARTMALAATVFVPALVVVAMAWRLATMAASVAAVIRLPVAALVRAGGVAICVSGAAVPVSVSSVSGGAVSVPVTAAAVSGAAAAVSVAAASAPGAASVS